MGSLFIRVGDAGAEDLVNDGSATGLASADTPAVAAETEPLPALLSTAEIGERFGRSARTIRRWVRRGYLVPVRVGGAVFFRAEDVRQLIVERLVASISKPNAASEPVSGEHTGMEDNPM